MANKNEGKTMRLGVEMASGVSKTMKSTGISHNTTQRGGAALLVGGAVSGITDGVFDDIGSTIGGAVDDVVDGISDFVGGLFGWG